MSPHELDHFTQQVFWDYGQKLQHKQCENDFQTSFCPRVRRQSATVLPNGLVCTCLIANTLGAAARFQSLTPVWLNEASGGEKPACVLLGDQLLRMETARLRSFLGWTW